jgi:hypothetical protein
MCSCGRGGGDLLTLILVAIIDLFTVRSPHAAIGAQTRAGDKFEDLVVVVLRHHLFNLHIPPSLLLFCLSLSDNLALQWHLTWLQIAFRTMLGLQL